MILVVHARNRVVAIDLSGCIVDIYTDNLCIYTNANPHPLIVTASEKSINDFEDAFDENPNQIVHIFGASIKSKRKEEMGN